MFNHNKSNELGYTKDAQECVDVLNQLDKLFADAKLIKDEEEEENWQLGSIESSGIIRAKKNEPVSPMAVLYFYLPQINTKEKMSNNLYFSTLEKLGVSLSHTTKSFSGGFVAYVAEISPKNIPQVIQFGREILQRFQDGKNPQFLDTVRAKADEFKPGISSTL